VQTKTALGDDSRSLNRFLDIAARENRLQGGQDRFIDSGRCKLEGCHRVGFGIVGR